MPNLNLKLVHKFELIAALPLIACAIILLVLGAVYSYTDQQLAEAQRAREAMDSCEYIQRTLVQATAQMWVTGSEAFDSRGNVVQRTRNKVNTKIRHLEELCADHPEELKTLTQLKTVTSRSLDYMEKSTTMKTDHGAAVAMKIMGFQMITKEQSEEIENLIHQFKIQLGSQLQTSELPTVKETMTSYIVIATVCIFLISIISVHLLNRNVVNRLAKLSANSAKLAKLDELTKPTGGNDEIAELDQTFYQMATALAEAIKREKATIENAADVICTLNSEGTILSVNDACSAWGLDSHELRGRNLLEVVYPDDRVQTNNYLVRTFAGAEVSELENRLVTESGSLKYLLWSFRLGLDGEELFAIAHDITERKLAQDKLRASEDRFAAIKEKSPAGIVLLNADGKIIEANPAALAIVGASAEEMSDSMMQEIIPELKFEALNLVRLREHQILQSDGTMRTADIIFDKLGRSEHELLSVLLDTTDRHQLERLKETLVAMIAHDIATPITTIHSQLHLAQAGAMGPLSDAGLSAVDNAEEQSVEVMNLLTTIMKTAKYKHAAIVNGLTRTSLADLVEATVESTTFERESRNIDVHLQIDRSIQVRSEPDSLAHAFKVVLSQIIRTCATGKVLTFETVHNEEEEQVYHLYPFRLRIAHPVSEALPEPTGLTWEFAKAIVNANGGQLNYVSTTKFIAAEFELDRG